MAESTLHYYNDIGVFCPEVVSDNGYHYYTCFQFAQLELILTLRKIIRSQPISGKYDHDDFSVAAKFSIRLKKLFDLYDSFGSRISAENITSRKFNCYDSFFAYCPDNSETYNEILPKGCYLKTYCIGEWENIPQIYTNLLEYAHQNNFLLEGFAYEEGLTELSVKSGNDYITICI